MQDKIKTLKILTISLLVFIVLLVLAMLINFVKLGKENSRKQQLEAQLAMYQAQYDQNESDLTLLESEQFITRYARLNLDMKGKDEKVFSSAAE